MWWHSKFVYEFPFSLSLRDVTCRVFCAKVVGATSSEGFLVSEDLSTVVLPEYLPTTTWTSMECLVCLYSRQLHLYRYIAFAVSTEWLSDIVMYANVYAKIDSATSEQWGRCIQLLWVADKCGSGKMAVCTASRDKETSSWILPLGMRARMYTFKRES